MILHRKVIRITADDSPNVQFAKAEIAAGLSPSGATVVPGVLSWDQYKSRRATWDKIRQCIGLDAQFYLGAELLLFPPEWLNRAEQYADSLRGQTRKARGVGIDTAEGGDDTSMAAVDELGLIESVSKKTPDTSVILGEAIAFCSKHGVPPERVFADRGGGGKQLADNMKAKGWPIKTIGFGEAVLLEPRRGKTMFDERVTAKEQGYEYKNRRAQMYYELSELLDPARAAIFGATKGAIAAHGFAIDRRYAELRRQLAPIPRTTDPEGRLYLLPKNKKSPDSKERTLTELIGRSPDDADAFVLAVHAMLAERVRARAGAV